MGYREDYFKANEGITIAGKRGKYYRCVSCGKLFPKSQVDIDHKISKRYGGTDDIWNLQVMCIHCNRSKGKNSSNVDVISSVVGATCSEGVDGVGKIVKGVATQKVKDILGIKYKR